MGKSFKTYLKEQFEALLNERLREDKENFKDLSEVKIADIIFAFNNSELIKLLRARGSHIMYTRYD